MTQPNEDGCPEMGELHIPSEVGDAMRNLRPELRAKLSLRDIDDVTRPLRKRIRELEAENARLKKDAQHWWNMIEFTDATSMRDIHALAQDGCRLFYLRPAESE